MLEITRELVEHYLRATGWAKDTEPHALVGLRWRNTADVTERICDKWIDEAVSKGEPCYAFPFFRLGLCAAAESMLLWASEWQLEKEEYRPGDTMDERCIRLLRESAERQLQNAGITSDAWESARKR